MKRATGSMAGGGRLSDAPAPEWERPDEGDLFAGGAVAAEAWSARIAARPKRLMVACTGTKGGEPCGANRVQGSEHPVKPCDACGLPGLQHAVRACDHTPGVLVQEQDGRVFWRPA